MMKVTLDACRTGDYPGDMTFFVRFDTGGEIDLIVRVAATLDDGVMRLKVEGQQIDNDGYEQGEHGPWTPVSDELDDFVVCWCERELSGYYDQRTDDMIADWEAAAELY